MDRKSWLIGVFAVLAFGQTLAYYVYLRDDPGNYNGAGASGDQVAYIDLAQQILHGTWQGAVHYMPGLPAVIAVGQVLTGDPRLGIALIQALLYAVLVIVAARLATRDGRYTGRLAAPPLVGEARAAWLRSYAARDGANLKRSYAYADSHSDLPLLEAVGNPVAVNPDVALFRKARKKRWPVEDWHRSTGTPRVLFPEEVPR